VLGEGKSATLPARVGARTSGRLRLVGDGELLTGAHALGPELARDVRLITSPANADAAGRPAAHPESPDASKRGLAAPVTGARKEPVVFVELDTRQDAEDTVSDTAGAAFRDPFRYAR
jgi:hypothetical protein